jgi:hypothetical protein
LSPRRRVQLLPDLKSAEQTSSYGWGATVHRFGCSDIRADEGSWDL